MAKNIGLKYGMSQITQTMMLNRWNFAIHSSSRAPARPSP